MISIIQFLAVLSKRQASYWTFAILGEERSTGLRGAGPGHFFSPAPAALAAKPMH